MVQSHLRPPTPDDKKMHIVAQWLSGQTRDQIAANLSISGGTVSNVVGELSHHMGQQQAEGLRKFATLAEKNRISLEAAAEGYELMTKLRQTAAIVAKEGEGGEDADADWLAEFLDKVLGEMAKSKASPAATGRAIAAISHMIEKEKMDSPQEIQQHIQRLIDEKKSLELQVAALRKKKEEEQQAVESELRVAQTTRQQLSEHRAFKQELQKHGLSMEDPSKFVHALRIFKEEEGGGGGQVKNDGQPFKLKSVVEKLSTIETLEGEKKELEEAISLKKEKETELRQSVADLADQSIKKQMPLAELTALELMGFGYQEISDLKDKLKQIIIARAKEHKQEGEGKEATITTTTQPLPPWPREYVRSFLNDLVAQYDEKLGFEAEIRRLRKEKSILEKSTEVLKVQEKQAAVSVLSYKAQKDEMIRNVEEMMGTYKNQIEMISKENINAIRAFSDESKEIMTSLRLSIQNTKQGTKELRESARQVEAFTLLFKAQLGEFVSPVRLFAALSWATSSMAKSIKDPILSSELLGISRQLGKLTNDASRKIQG